MKPKLAAVLAVRSLVGAFLFTTALYALCAYLPFTYQQVHQGNLFPALSAFARWLPYSWAPVMALAAWPLAGPGPRRVSFVLFTAVHAGVAIWLWAHPFVSQLQSPTASLMWCVAAFGSMAWTGILDWAMVRERFEWPRPAGGGGGRLFTASLASAAVLSFAFWTTVILRTRPARLDAPALLFSLDAHLFLFLGLFAALALTRALSELSAEPARTEFWTVAALAALAVRFVLARMFFPVVSFEGPGAECVAAFLAAAGVLYWTGICARLAAAGGAAGDGLALFLAPLAPGFVRSRLAGAGVLAAVVAAGCAASAAAAGMDWNYLGQKTAAMLVWVAAFAVFYRMTACGARERTVAGLLVSIGFLGGHHALAARGTSFDSAGHAGYNASYKVLYDWMAKPEGSSDYYRLLESNTNLPRERRLAPAEVNLAGGPKPAGPGLPDIYLFVIDSLRRDYLAPYNPKVTFTPAIAAFAAESVVERNAFTRYAGTGLSEPSIWAGAMLPHKQYVTPFHPMNSLEKLLDRLGYHRYVTIDSILEALLERPASVEPLDATTLDMGLDLGRTLRELAAKLNARTASGPVFAYTQPQNLHVSVINRAGRSVPEGESYPGFDAAYASRLRRIDAAFGEFIAFLKQRGRYENSIVILTADHGDSLGEGGRWGHAYSLVTEVVRVPLILHVPARLEEGLVHETAGPAFLTDIAPTLYELLGQGPVNQGELYGKPLFASDAALLASYRRARWLLASSYAPVYGMLTGGRELYVSDAIEYRESLYDLESSASLTVTSADRREGQQFIRDGIRNIAAYYGAGRAETAWAGRVSR